MYKIRLSTEGLGYQCLVPSPWQLEQKGLFAAPLGILCGCDVVKVGYMCYNGGIMKFDAVMLDTVASAAISKGCTGSSRACIDVRSRCYELVNSLGTL